MKKLAKSSDKTTRIVLGTISGILVLLCVSILCVVIILSTATTTSVKISFFFHTITSSPTFPPTPTPVPSIIPTATEPPTPSPLSWDFTFMDDFSTNMYGWPEVNNSQECGAETMVVIDDKLRWVLNTYAGEGCYWQEIPSRLPIVANFDLAIDLFSVAGSPGADEAGLVFREMDGIGQYVFLINDVDQRFYVALYGFDGGWTTLIPETSSTYIKPGDTNRLRVFAQESHFTFYINDHFVGEVDDNTFSEGYIGVGANQHYNGVWNTYNFYNLELRATK